MKPIYLDYAATTPVDQRVVNKMMNCLTINGVFGNPASHIHVYGREAEALVEQSRQQIANFINCSPREIAFTSGATESNNLAIKGVAEFHKHKGRHIVTTLVEHKSVLDTCSYLQENGFEVTYLKPKSNGSIDLNQIKKVLRDDTILVSLIFVNNELGVINPINDIAKITRERNILFHVDAAQAVGKVPVDVEKLDIDLLSLSGHKLYGPKGVGVLYIRQKPRVRLTPQIHGGGHEFGFRSGTLATHQIVGLGEACAILNDEMSKEVKVIKKLRNRFLQGIKNIDAIKLNTDLNQSVPHILNISFNYISGESLIVALNELAISLGAACTSANLETSHVLRALNLSDEIANGSVRLSFGRFTTVNDVDRAIELVNREVLRLRELSPLWEMYKKGIDIDEYDWGATLNAVIDI